MSQGRSSLTEGGEWAGDHTDGPKPQDLLMVQTLGAGVAPDPSGPMDAGGAEVRRLFRPFQDPPLPGPRAGVAEAYRVPEVLQAEWLATGKVA